jgi:hypothetical protein
MLNSKLVTPAALRSKAFHTEARSHGGSRRKIKDKGKNNMSWLVGVGHALPNALQLMQARQLSTQTGMTLETLTMGSCADKNPLVCAGRAQKRTRSLIKVLGKTHDNTQDKTQHKTTVEYDPCLGIDVAVVTFKPRSF